MEIWSGALGVHCSSLKGSGPVYGLPHLAPVELCGQDCSIDEGHGDLCGHAHIQVMHLYMAAMQVDVGLLNFSIHRQVAGMQG